MEVFQTIYQHHLLTESDLVTVAAAHQKISFSRHHHFLEAGQIAHNYYVMESGLARTYVMDSDGNEMTTGFIREGEILIEAASLFQRTPTVEYLQALTDGVAWKMEYDTFQQLFHDIEGVREWGRNWMISQWFDLKRRTNAMITNSAKDRYLALMKENPEVLRLAPLKQIASYLGITDSSLSRIRREVTKS